jgi:molecular chaperone GrpE (heat shock protein)
MDPNLVSAALDRDTEVAIEVPKSHHTTNNTTNNIDIATDKELLKATTRITCKDCNRQFATISTEDRLVPCNPQQQKCTSCEPFQELYETLQSREQEHAALLDKGPTHLGRVTAHWKYRNARVALENFLINIEAPDKTTQAAFVTHADGVQTEREAELNGISKHGEKNVHGLPTEVSPTTKRRLAQKSGDSNTERKRIKFTDTVQESPQYRTTLEYYRGAKEYVPGKYGAAEGSELLDTSGSTLTFAKFTGQKKVGPRFVDIVEREVVDCGKEPPSATIQQKKGKSKKAPNKVEMPCSEPGDNEGRSSTRALRSSRQYRSTTSSATTRSREDIMQYGAQDDETTHRATDEQSRILAPKFPVCAETSTLTADEETTKGTDDCQQLDAGQEITKADTEVEKINRAVLNIQRELSHLQRTVVSAQRKKIVSAAIRTFFDVLEPLKHLDTIDPDLVKETESPEDDSIYFEALDATDHQLPTNVLHADEGPGRGETPSERIQARTRSENTHAFGNRLPPKPNTFANLSKEGEQNQQMVEADDACAHDIEHGSGFVSKPEHNNHAKASDLPHHGVADAPLPSIDPTLINNPLNTAITGPTLNNNPLNTVTGFGTMPVLHPSCFQPMQFALPQSVYVDPSHRREQGSPVQSENGPSSRGHHANIVDPDLDDTHAGSEGAVAGQFIDQHTLSIPRLFNSEPGPE